MGCHTDPAQLARGNNIFYLSHDVETCAGATSRTLEMPVFHGHNENLINPNDLKGDCSLPCVERSLEHPLEIINCAFERPCCVTVYGCHLLYHSGTRCVSSLALPLMHRIGCA